MKLLSGKVIGEFICNNVNVIEKTYSGDNCFFDLTEEQIKSACLTDKEIDSFSKSKQLYAWKISDVKMYDKPLELSEFNKPCDCTQEHIRYCKESDKGCVLTKVRGTVSPFVYVIEK